VNGGWSLEEQSGTARGSIDEQVMVGGSAAEETWVLPVAGVC